MSYSGVFCSLSWTRLSLSFCRMYLDKIIMCEVPNLGVKFTPSMAPNKEITVNTQGSPTCYNKLLGPRDCIIYGEGSVRSKRRPFASI